MAEADDQTSKAELAKLEVLEQALALTPEQRLYLAAELLASIDGEPSETWEAARRNELDDRMREAEAKLNDAIERGLGDIKAGRFRPARDVLADLRRRHG